MKIRELMTTEVTAGSPESTLQELANLMRDEDVGSIPIVEDGELAGIVTDRDIVVRCIAEGRDPNEVTADEIVTEDLATITPEDDVAKAARLMADKQIRRLPVVEDGHLVGMLAIGDIAVRQGERVSGEVLEDVSASAKASGHQARAQQSGKRASGGIANRAIRRGQKPRSRVVPIRDGAAVPERRNMHRAGGKAKRRKVS